MRMMSSYFPSSQLCLPSTAGLFAQQKQPSLAIAIAGAILFHEVDVKLFELLNKTRHHLFTGQESGPGTKTVEQKQTIQQ